jgi:hypothetical protein
MIKDSSIHAIIRSHPAPKPGQRGFFKSFEAFSAYLEFHHYQVQRFYGDEIVIEPIPADIDDQDNAPVVDVIQQ